MPSLNMLEFFASARKAPDPTLAAPVQSMNLAAVKLLQKLAPEAQGNLVFFPASVHPILTLALAGAEGKTAAELRKALGVEDRGFFPPYLRLLRSLHGNKQFELSNKTGLWVAEDVRLLSAYLQICADFRCDFARLDFSDAAQAARIVNSWAKKATKGKIGEIADPDMFGPLTQMVLTNATCFKGSWIERFKKKKTKNRAFSPDGEKSCEVPTMEMSEDFRMLNAEGWRVL